MAKNPNIPAKAVRRAIEKSIAARNREIFETPLAQALFFKPRDEDLKSLRTDPEKWSRHIKTLAGLNGFADRTEHISAHYDMAKLAETLLARHGPDKLVTIWQSMNLPMSQLPEQCRESQPVKPQGTTIEGELEPIKAASVAT